jgi:DNA-binding MarR family transcriptional regulator
MDIKQLNQRYALHLAELELAQYMGELYPAEEGEGEKIRNYFMSTPNRRAFGIKCAICTLKDMDCPPSKIAQRIGVSINAVDTMISECESCGWIEVTRLENNYRRVRASQVLVDQWVKYATVVADYSVDKDFGGIQSARKYHKAIG